MSSDKVTQFLNSRDLDRQYHKTVLKVPDSLGLVKGAVLREMDLTQRELFEVNNFFVFSESYYYMLFLSRDVSGV